MSPSLSARMAGLLRSTGAKATSKNCSNGREQRLKQAKTQQVSTIFMMISRPISCTTRTCTPSFLTCSAPSETRGNKESPLVKPERRKQYPKNWESLARQCKEQAGNQCAFCHIRQGAQRISKRTGACYTVFLHAAHKNHDAGNAVPDLLCLCPTCHGKYDFQYRRMAQYIALEQKKHRMLLHAR